MKKPESKEGKGRQKREYRKKKLMETEQKFEEEKNKDRNFELLKY